MSSDKDIVGEDKDDEGFEDSSYILSSYKMIKRLLYLARWDPSSTPITPQTST